MEVYKKHLVEMDNFRGSSRLALSKRGLTQSSKQFSISDITSGEKLIKDIGNAKISVGYISLLLQKYFNEN
jgi:hypothetical protein